MKKIYNIKITTIIMVLLPILSIFIGYFGVKLYLLSNDNFNDEIDINKPGVEEIIVSDDPESDDLSNDSVDSNDTSTNQGIDENSNTEKKVTNRIDGINYYSIQAGSFSNKENAQEFRDTFVEKDHFAYYLENGNYKVFVAASPNKKGLEEELESVITVSPDAFIKNVELKSKNFSYTIDDKDYFENISNIISNQLNEIDASVSIDKIEDALDSLEKENIQFIETNESNKNIGNQVTGYIDGVRNEISTLDTDDEESIKAFFEKNIDLFIKYFQ